LEDFDSLGTDQSFSDWIYCFIERLNPVRKGGALNPILNKEPIFFLSSPFQVAGLSNGVKKEVKDDYSNIKRFSPYLKPVFLQTHHHPISRGEGSPGETVERDSIF
jgi:hypothetical protein